MSGDSFVIALHDKEDCNLSQSSELVCTQKDLSWLGFSLNCWNESPFPYNIAFCKVKTLAKALRFSVHFRFYQVNSSDCAYEDLEEVLNLVRVVFLVVL